MAISDPTGTIAQALPTILRRRGRRPPFAAIVETIREYGVERVVIGLPLESSGDEDALAAEVRDFGGKLEARAGIPVVYRDERFTSVRAERELARLELKAKARREKERVDAMAATLILQAYLDTHRES